MVSGPSQRAMANQRERDAELGAVVDELVAVRGHLPDPPALPRAATTARSVLTRGSTQDPLNAICRWVEVRGPGSGPLAGIRATVKDSVAIGGLPMTCGSAALEDFVPAGDASVVRALLDAGAEIVAMTTMDDLAFSGGGDSSIHGPVLNPHDQSRSAGGSSGGAAASLYYEDIDVAIGTDQGGSSRVPASWCGVLGLKPTHGLVPYTGVAASEPMLDHIGVLARNAGTLARVLRAMAVKDGADPRQLEVANLAEPAPSLDGRKAVVLTALTERSDPSVAAAFRRDCELVESLGIEVTSTSLDPDSFGPIAAGLFVEGLWASINGTVTSFGHDYVEWHEFTQALQNGIQSQEERLSPAVRATLAAAARLHEGFPGQAYARAAAQARQLRKSMVGLTSEYDFVLTPTTPFVPFAPGTDPADQVRRGWAVLANTGFANITGQPALSIPLSKIAGLPSGLQVLGAHGTDLGLISLAERLLDAVGDTSEGGV